MAAIALALVSCSKEAAVGVVETSLRATLQPEFFVRSGSVEAETPVADHALLEIWRNGRREARQEQSITPGSSVINFSNVKLAAGFDYDVFIWVDNVGFYDTSNLPSVSLNPEKSYDGKTPQFDAFYSYSQMHSSQNNEVHNVTLRRPFAKINFSAAVTKNANVSFTAPTTLNLKTGAVSGERAVGYTAEHGTSGVTAFDYIFATEDVSQLSYTFKLGEDAAKTTYVPVKRNTRTNIIYNTTD